MKQKLILIMLLCGFLVIGTSCKDDKTYAELLQEEQDSIDKYLKGYRVADIRQISMTWKLRMETGKVLMLRITGLKMVFICRLSLRGMVHLYKKAIKFISVFYGKT